jgi:hypothetical protein
MQSTCSTVETNWITAPMFAAGILHFGRWSAGKTKASTFSIDANDPVC